jgi:hypothetical protein
MTQLHLDEALWKKLEHRAAIAPKGTKEERMKALREHTRKMLEGECRK